MNQQAARGRKTHYATQKAKRDQCFGEKRGFEEPNECESGHSKALITQIQPQL